MLRLLCVHGIKGKAQLLDYTWFHATISSLLPCLAPMRRVPHRTVLCDWWNSLRWSVRQVLPHPQRRRLLRAVRKNGSKDDCDAKEAWKHSNGGGHGDVNAMGNGVHETVSEATAGAGL